MKVIRCAAAVCFGLLTLEGRAFAQSGQPSYTVDAAQGPVTGSTRVIGLGGAFVAVAEDMDGVAANPASVAVRLPYSWHRWDYGFGVDFAIGAWLPETDFLNQAPSDGQQQPGQAAEVEQRSLLFGSIGATVYYEHAGIGVSAEGQQQALQRSGDTMAGLAPRDLSGNFGIVHSSIGYGFFDGQLVVGIGPRITGVSLSRGSSTSGLLSVAGVGYQAGFVYKPLDQQVRVGAAYKSQVSPSLGSSGTSTEDSVFSATALRLPWQASAGLAYQFGARPFNPPLVTAEDQTRAFRKELDQKAAERERELERAESRYELDRTPENDELLAREKAWARREEESDEQRLAAREEQVDDALRAAYLARPRFYVLVTTELLVLGRTPGSVDLGSFYADSGVQLSGQNHTLSGRLGVETEVVPNWLKLRAGTYLEPARVSTGTDRVHATFGFDVKLFRWDVFGLIGDFDSWLASAAIDSARDYLSTSFSIGFWH